MTPKVAKRQSARGVPGTTAQLRIFPAGGSVVTYYLDSTKSRCYSTKHPLRSNHKGYGAGIFLMFGLKIKKDLINNLNNHKILNHLKKTKTRSILKQMTFQK